MGILQSEESCVVILTDREISCEIIAGGEISCGKFAGHPSTNTARVYFVPVPVQNHCTVRTVYSTRTVDQKSISIALRNSK